MINDNNEVCLADFGLSRFLETSGFTTTTVNGATRWMAHELLILPDDYDDEIRNAGLLYTTATDVWAFAMTTIEARCMYICIYIRHRVNFLLDPHGPCAICTRQERYWRNRCNKTGRQTST